jgi:hypothetical protein
MSYAQDFTEVPSRLGKPLSSQLLEEETVEQVQKCVSPQGPGRQGGYWVPQACLLLLGCIQATNQSHMEAGGGSKASGTVPRAERSHRRVLGREGSL